VGFETRSAPVWGRLVRAPVGLSLVQGTRLEIVPEVVGVAEGVATRLFIGGLLEDVGDREIMGGLDIINGV